MKLTLVDYHNYTCSDCFHFSEIKDLPEMKSKYLYAEGICRAHPPTNTSVKTIEVFAFQKETTIETITRFPAMRKICCACGEFKLSGNRKRLSSEQDMLQQTGD